MKTKIVTILAMTACAVSVQASKEPSKQPRKSNTEKGAADAKPVGDERDRVQEDKEAFRKKKAMKEIPKKILKLMLENVKGEILDIYRENHYYMEAKEGGKRTLSVFDQYGTLFKYKVDEPIAGDGGEAQLDNEFGAHKRLFMNEKALPAAVAKAVTDLKVVKQELKKQKLKFSHETFYFAEVKDGPKDIYVFDKHGKVVEWNAEDEDEDDLELEEDENVEEDDS